MWKLWENGSRSDKSLTGASDSMALPFSEEECFVLEGKENISGTTVLQ